MIVLFNEYENELQKLPFMGKSGLFFFGGGGAPVIFLLNGKVIVISLEQNIFTLVLILSLWDLISSVFIEFRLDFLFKKILQ